jgi:hypothetical protein
MKILLAFSLFDFLSIKGDMLEFDEFITQSYNENNKSYLIDTDHEKFVLLTQLTKEVNQVNFLPQMRFSAEEVESMQYFELVGGRLLRESDGDFNKNLKYEENSELISTGSNYSIKLIDKRFLKKVSLKPDTIGCVSENRISDFIVSEKIRQTFVSSGLHGANYIPLYHTNGKDAHEGYYQIFTKEILPPAKDDLTFKIIEIGDSIYFNKLGSFSYDYSQIDTCADFFRSAEPVYCEETTAMIVSRNVFDCYCRNNLKGLIFKPALDTNSALYSDYIEKWEMVFKKVFVNPRNSLLEYSKGDDSDNSDDLIKKIDIVFGKTGD